MHYLSLSDYGLIGNLGSAALISRTGSIDWCAFPYLDSPAHFTSVADENPAARFQIAPVGDYRTEQNYLQRTGVLETHFHTPYGRALLTDWMPLEPPLSHSPICCRKLEVLEGRIRFALSCSPSFDNGSRPGRAEPSRGGVLFRGLYDDELLHLRGDRTQLVIAGDRKSVHAELELQTGRELRFQWGWGRQALQPHFPDPLATVERWRSWSHSCSGAPGSGTCVFGGPWHDLIVRSAITLRMLGAGTLGGVAEAVADSSHSRRTASLRDSAMLTQALGALGHRQELRSHFSWLCDILLRDAPESLQATYTLDGGPVSPRRFHADVFGQVMLAAVEYYRIEGALPDPVWDRLAEIAESVCQAWRRPDYGPWPGTIKPEHHVSSKLFCWAALDRACWLARALGKAAPARWFQERDILHRTICEQGYDEGRKAFVRAFGERELDASVLQLILLRFLPPEDPRVSSTLHAIRAALGDGALIRSSESTAHAYSAGGGLHLWSSFLFVSCLALAGEADEASDRLTSLCASASPQGLLAERINPRTAEPLGAFPSALTHLAMINASLYIGMARGRTVPIPHLVGTPDRITLPRSA